MKRDTKIVGAVLAWIGAAIGGAALAGTWAPDGVRLLFRIFCHGMAERSLSLFGEAMPICARCFGIYAGLILGVAIFATWPRIEEQAARMFVFAAALPMAIDGLTQAAALRVSTNPLRLATGIMAATAFGIWALSAVQHRRAEPRQDFLTP